MHPYLYHYLLAKELWRLRVNFFVLLVLLLVSIGDISPLASLHQFVINPTLEEQNGTSLVQAYMYITTSRETVIVLFSGICIQVAI